MRFELPKFFKSLILTFWKVVNDILNNQISNTMFDKVQKEIVALMRMGPFMDFLEHDLFKSFLRERFPKQGKDPNKEKKEEKREKRKKSSATLQFTSLEDDELYSSDEEIPPLPKQVDKPAGEIQEGLEKWEDEPQFDDDDEDLEAGLKSSSKGSAFSFN